MGRYGHGDLRQLMPLPAARALQSQAVSHALGVAGAADLGTPGCASLQATGIRFRLRIGLGYLSISGTLALGGILVRVTGRP